MLRVDKNELPEYNRNWADVRDRYNLAAKALEKDGLVALEWIYGQPVFAKVILNLDQVDRAYRETGRRHPKQAAEETAAVIEETLSKPKTPWIAAWRDDACRTLQEEWKLPAICKKGEAYLRDFLHLLACYDDLSERSTTVRAFSSKCFSNSKRFEREFQEDLLRVAERWDPELRALCSQEDLSSRVKLAYLGIYAHPEIYQMCGRCTVQMADGAIDLAALYPAGIGIPSTAVEMVRSFSLEGIRRITFLENKTNYEEYLLTEMAPDELTVYHGGFLSPKKRSLLSKLAASLRDDIQVLFWADIDLGGFAMFERLQRIFPQLQPMRMGRTEVEQYAQYGLRRPESYLETLREARDEGRYPLFREAMDAILQHGVTIEQEIFLGQ